MTTRTELTPTPHAEASRRVGALGTILGVWAHPDDEVYLSAGVMRLALENGQRVGCVTATVGEHGTDDPATWPPDALGPTRRAELQASFDALAAGQESTIEHSWLDYRDGQCAGVEPRAAAGRLGAIIDRLRPDTILTFDSTGLTGHTDHRTVAAWTSIALESRPGIRRLDAVVARSWVDHFGDSIDIGSYFDDGYPHIVDDRGIDLELVLGDDLWDTKDKALRAHATQTAPVIDQLGDELWRAFSIAETFIVHTDPAQPDQPTKTDTKKARP